MRICALALSIGALALSISCSKESVGNRIPADWRTWRRTTEVELDYPIPGHSDVYRIIRANPVAFAVSRRSEGGHSRLTFGPGAIVAKEIYANNPPRDGEAAQSLYFMIKSPADTAARGGWVWGLVDLASGKETIMPGGFCAGCHANANEPYPYADKNPDSEYRDFVFFPPGLPGADPAGYP